MSTDSHLPADARARRAMLAAHLEKSARKMREKSQPRWQATHLKLPPVHGNQAKRPESD